MVHRRGPELGNRTFRISAPSSRESGWLHHNEPGSAQSFAGSHHALGSFFHSLCSTCISTSDSIFSGPVCALSAQSISCSVHKVPISDEPMKTNDQSSRRRFLKAGGIFIAASGISAAANLFGKEEEKKSQIIATALLLLLFLCFAAQIVVLIANRRLLAGRGESGWPSSTPPATTSHS